MSRTTCFTCGTSYEGWKCPTCFATDQMREATEDLASRVEEAAAETAAAHAEASEQLAERLAGQLAEEHQSTRQAYQEAADRVEQVTAQATIDQRQAIAESWKLQAKAKGARAYELYRADLHQEAVALARQAIAQDPGNLTGYKVAAWSLESLGDMASAREFFGKQLGLLLAADYRESPTEFRSIVKGLPKGDRDLERTARKVAGQLISSWPVDEGILSALEVLIAREWVEEVRILMARVVKSPNLGSLYKVLYPGVAMLWKADLLPEARQLVSASIKSFPHSLLSHAMAMDLAEEGDDRAKQAFEEWLGAVPPSERAPLRNSLESLRRGEIWKTSPPTLTAIRAAIVERRRTWEPLVAADMSAIGSRLASDPRERERKWKELYLPGGPVTQGCVVTLLGWIAIAVLFGALKLSPVFFLPACLVLILFGVGGPLVQSYKVQSALFKEGYEAGWAAEHESWRKAGI